MLFRQLDFLYMPSGDVAADVAYFRDVLHGTVLFAIEAMGTRVAGIRLTEAPPVLLLAGHLQGEHPVLVYRVPELAAALAELESRGWPREASFEIPHGPCCSFRTPGGHRLALYELTRPDRHFEGRLDF
ncbi:MAG: hypothetical protein QOK40_1605 [Miltoncostaeaceae bacterium]|nr:hypothetical protein [Miltoncostaeaceae bacterium]